MTKIEWTDEKSIIPMLIDMTFSTGCSNIQQIAISIATIVMILIRFLATIKTRAITWFYQSPSFYSPSNSIGSFLLLIFRCWKTLAFNFLFNSTTLLTHRTKPISAIFVFVKLCWQFPAFALPTPLETFNFYKVIIIRNTNLLCRHFLNTDYRTHNILLKNSVGAIIPIGKSYVKN